MSRPIVLDRETCFKKWVDLGSLLNVSIWFEKQGISNSFTGKKYSASAISYAARRWVVQNPEEARKYYEQAGMYLSDEDWTAWLVNTMLKVFHSHQRHHFEAFLDKHDIRDKYGYIIGEG